MRTAIAPGRKLAVRVNIFLALALLLNVAFWTGSRHVFMKWEGVPPVPTEAGALMMSLGDPEFAYRMGALILQQLGDGGGQTSSLKDYDYTKLDKWFWLLNKLDPASDQVPLLAAYYFGAVQDPQKIAIVVNYLATVGQSPYGSKWRWLSHAVLMARHGLNDLDLALELATKLSKMEPIGDTLPHWAKQMPAFIMTKKGDKEDAREFLENLLLNSEKFHRNEVNFIKSYLVEQLNVPEAEIEEIMKRRTLPLQEDTSIPKRPLWAE